MKYKFVDIENTRTEKQRDFYQDIADKNIDPFELEHLKIHHPHPVIFENTSWFLTHNAFPYEDTSLHLLIVHKDFITSIEQISQQAWIDLQEIIKFSVEEFKLTSGGFFMRFGDTTKTGSTVTHLHAHIIVSDGDSTDRRSMYVKIGKN